MNENTLKSALDEALRLGAADADAVWARSVHLAIEVAKGEVENLSRAESIGLGVRVFTPDHRIGFAYTTESDGDSAAVARAAWDNALANEADPFNVLPEEVAQSDDDWTEERFEDRSASEKVDFCKRLERRVLETDSRISHVQEAAYSEGSLEYVIANSRGLMRRYLSARCSCSVVGVAAAEGVDSEMGWEWDSATRFEALRADWVARRCVERATRALGGKPCATGKMPLVLDNYVAMQLLQVLAQAVSAEAVLKGRSLFAGRVGEEVASNIVSIVDQNDIEGGLNRAPFDGEGVSARRTPLVEHGRLMGFLHNAYTAHRMQQPLTANAGRSGGFRSTPEISPSNLYMASGTRPPESLVEEAGSGLFITRVMGLHMADPVSGDFSLGVQGFMIEEGRLGAPVRGVTVAGNLKDYLQSIVDVADDLRFFGSCGAPTVRVSAMMVSGL